MIKRDAEEVLGLSRANRDDSQMSRRAVRILVKNTHIVESSSARPIM